MALPVAHGLLGATVAVLFQVRSTKSNVNAILAAAVLAISPDLDYVFYRTLNWGESWHRGFTHSAVFAVAAGTVGAILVGPPKTRSVVMYSLATLSHPILDAFVTELSGGVQLLWPFSDQRFRFGVFDYTNILSGGPSWLSVFMRAVRISLVELLVFGPVLVGSLWLRKRQLALAGTEKGRK